MFLLGKRIVQFHLVEAVFILGHLAAEPYLCAPSPHATHRTPSLVPTRVTGLGLASVVSTEPGEGFCLGSRVVTAMQSYDGF